MDLPTKIRPGMYVKIYEDPITQTKCEGIARVVTARPRNTAGDYFLLVAFRDDAGPFSRTVRDPVELVPASCSGFES